MSSINKCVDCEAIGNWVEVSYEEYLCEDCLQEDYAECEECSEIHSKSDGEFRDDMEQVFWCLECIEREEERNEEDKDEILTKTLDLIYEMEIKEEFSKALDLLNELQTKITKDNLNTLFEAIRVRLTK